MKLVYGIPKRANSKRPTARHLDNGEGEPTCKICQDLSFMMQGEADETPPES
jgi:hypothetical protein